MWGRGRLFFCRRKESVELLGFGGWVLSGCFGSIFGRKLGLVYGFDEWILGRFV